MSKQATDEHPPPSDPPDVTPPGVSEPADGAHEAAAQAPPTPRSGETSGAGRTAWLVLAIAVFLALAAVSGTGFLWWQYRQFYVSLAAADASAESSLQRARSTLRELEDRTAALETNGAAAASRADALAARLDAVPPRLTELERRIEAMQGVSFDARTQWLRAEALYYLELANSELALAGRWENAITALELADGRLRELADPSYGPVRASIAQKLLALRAVDLPDVAGLSYSLSELAGRARSFPLQGEPPGEYMGRRDGAEQAEPGLGRLWLAIKSAFASFVSIERRATPAERALTPLAGELTRRGFEVELGVARLALLAADEDAFEASVSSARMLLERDFDTSAAPVASAETFLGRLLELDIAPPRPDLSEPLNMLRRLPGGEGP